MALSKGLAVRSAFTPGNLWVPVLLLTLAYVVLVTEGLRVGPVPLNFVLVAITLGLWLVGGIDRSDPGRYPLGIPVLLLAIVVPVVWTAVAFVHPSLGGLEAADPTFVAQHASRFAYLLLYFPLWDLLARFGPAALLAVVVPVVGLCLVTIGIWVYHLATGDEMGTTEVFVFKGVIGLLPGGFRVFIGNQVMFVVVMAILLARTAVNRPGFGEVALFLLILASSWLSHTRGLWLGLIAVCGATVFLLVYSGLETRGRRRLLIFGGTVVGVVALVWVSVVAGLFEGPFGDASTTKRVQQAPELLDGFSENPVFGSGLGGTLSSDFVRSEDNPWSFELTYLQILFQMGLVGLITLVTVLGYVLSRGLANLRVIYPTSWMSLAGISAVVGVLAASATNPYLFSSFGMLTLAISFVLLAPPSPVEEGEPH